MYNYVIIQFIKTYTIILGTHEEATTSKYHNGFVECMNEVTRYLNNVPGLGDDIRVRLLEHIANRANATNDSSTRTANTNNTVGSAITATVKPMQQLAPMPSQKTKQHDGTPLPTAYIIQGSNMDINNNHIGTPSANVAQPIVIQSPVGGDANGIQVLNNVSMLSGQLGQGSIAFVIPADSLNNNGQLNGYAVPVQFSNSAASTGVQLPSSVDLNNSFHQDTEPIHSGTETGCHTPLNLSMHPDTKVKEFPAAPLNILQNKQSLGSCDTIKSEPDTVANRILPTSIPKSCPNSMVIAKDVKIEAAIPNIQNMKDVDNEEPVWRPF